MSVGELDDIWSRRIRKLLPQERITRVRNPVGMVVGMSLGQSVHREKIAGQLPLAKIRRSTVQRFSRFLQNKHFLVRRWYRPVAQQLLRWAAAHGLVRLIIDSTKGGTPYQLLMVGLAYRKRALLRLPTGVFYAQGIKANVLFFDRKPASEKPWTEKLWIYDLRTNQHFTLKEHPLTFEDLADFIACYHADNRHERQETERFRAFSYDALMQRDKVSLDIFWLKDESLEDMENLPAPDVLAAEIVENLEAALEQFRGILEELGEE